ncbi:MAG: MraY family glycosyltransferase [Candidatus Polarisedimenticolia bacterium]
MSYGILLVGAALVSFLLAFPVRRIAVFFNIVDHPERRKMHQIPIPLLGGVAVSLSWVLLSILAVSFLTFGQTEIQSYQSLVAGLLLIVILGIVDDVRGVSPPLKFAVQAAAAMIVVLGGTRMEAFTNPLGPSFEIGWLGIPLTVFWIVGVTNAMNLIDGLDGLAAGVAGIAALGLFALTAPGEPFVASLTIILVGAVAGFLPHNFYPAKIFLGDTGSMFFGFLLAVISVHGSFKASTATALFLPIICLGIPIFDTLFAILRRAKRRVNPFKADREHIHHRLVRIGLHHRNVVLVLYFVCAYLALTSYSIAQFSYQTAFLFMVLLTMGGIIGVRTLRFIEEKLESGLAMLPAASEAGETAGGRWSGPHRARHGFTTLVCQVGGFSQQVNDSETTRMICSDIRMMLSRRVSVSSIVVEPSGPSRLLLLLRTESLDPVMTALVQDGVAWYFEDHRMRFSREESFPRLHWVDLETPAPAEGGGDPAARAADAGSRTMGNQKVAMSFREGRPGVATP